MNVVTTSLLWFCLINLQGGDAAGYTNAFPTRLVYGITFPTGPSTRLIPEMNFTCNGVIVGYTAALRESEWNTEQNPIIQVWRKNSSHPGSYLKTSSQGIAISDGALCVDGLLNEVSSEVFHCNLNKTMSQVSVQPGDILGLELPEGTHDGILAFANVSRGPTNCIFTSQGLSSPTTLSNCDLVNWELPQFTLNVESSDSGKCIRGFPDIPVSEVGDRTRNTKLITLLIPEMNFTRNASIVGFIVTGRSLSGGSHSKVQFWRMNNSQNSAAYYRVGNVSLHVHTSSGGVCITRTVVGNTLLCILHDNLQVSIQPGDIFGLELPRTGTDEIWFTNGGPVNHVFEHQLGSYANLSDNGSYSNAQQLPQIILNFTSDHCSNGFPTSIIVLAGNKERGKQGKVTTRLFPDLKFGCSGTIMRVRAAVQDSNTGQTLKLQIWRESETQPGLYYKMSSTILIRWPNPPCYQSSLIRGIFQCTLIREDFRISVQPGDFLGLEIPPINNDDLKIYFKDGGPTNFVFQRRLDSTVDLFTEPHTITNDEPQINFLVAIDESKESCLSDITTTITMMPTATTTQVDMEPNSTFTTADYSTEPKSVGSSPAVSNNTITGVIGGIIAILLLVAIILLVAVLIQRRHRKQYTVVSNGHTNPIANPVYDGALYNRTLPTQECEASYKGDTPLNYNHIKFNVKQKEAVSLHMDDQSFNATYEMLETQHYEMTGPTLATHEEAYTYWEPANTVNDLHKQLSSNKYRELLRQQVKITKALGSGQFGVVSMGVWQSPTGAIEVAVKQLQSGVTEAEKIRFLQEAAINGQFRHPNVVQLMGVVTTGEPAMIVLELLSNGDLRNFLVRHQTPQKLKSGGVDKHLLLQFCQHIASGMSYLASKAFIHRDLAARNILVSKDRTCKISDFGMSRDLLDEDYYVSRGGMIPVKWTAPEAIHYKKYSTAGDVWSFGCVMYEIWSLGHKPFENYNNPEVIKMIEKGYRLPPPPGLSKELYKIMIQCWQPERSRRPTFPQLVELLSQADFELFLWEEEDLRNSDLRVKEIGAPLEIASGLYPELQRTYLGKQ